MLPGGLRRVPEGREGFSATFCILVDSQLPAASSSSSCGLMKLCHAPDAEYFFCP